MQFNLPVDCVQISDIIIYVSFKFQVEYTLYSTIDDPKHTRKITIKEETNYINRGFVKIEESAMCVVCNSNHYV